MQQSINQASQGAPLLITINCNHSALFSPSGATDVDFPASQVRFGQMVSDAIKTEYPGAFTFTSAVFHTWNVHIDNAGPSDRERISSICEEVYAAQEWVIVKS